MTTCRCVLATNCCDKAYRRWTQTKKLLHPLYVTRSDWDLLCVISHSNSCAKCERAKVIRVVKWPPSGCEFLNCLRLQLVKFIVASITADAAEEGRKKGRKEGSKEGRKEDRRTRPVHVWLCVVCVAYLKSKQFSYIFRAEAATTITTTTSTVRQSYA